ncbi:methyltransferase domain-containing protein [Microbacterium sp. R86528]|uniref:methyltransferase domain-containing protein n=1 Tax=Microbacterium sp. R86528 TaxID=3093864 RepID=UPI0037C9434F
MSTLISFGAGGDEPYALMLGATGSSALALRRIDDPTGTVVLDVEGWRSPANAVDLAVLADLDGPLLDVGCGPGRMVRAAEENGLAALGIDVSADAAALAATNGTPVLRRSIFERLPLEGSWATVLLMDGNIGIGGDPAALVSRCAELMADDGCLVVEVDVDPELLDCAVYTAVGQDGHESAPFPWARVGSAALARVGSRSGLVVADAWADGQRRFVVLRKDRVSHAPKR